MTPRTIRIWLLLSLLAVPALSPFLARGDAQKRQVRQANHDQIAAMSESERQRLERNFESFQRMTPDEQAKVRSFHQELQRDLSERQGELTAVLNDYQNWLTTLQPFERDQLANAASPQERIILMKRIVERQRERTAARSMQRGPLPPPGDDPMSRNLDRMRRFWMDMPVLSADELSRVMQAIEQQAQFRLTESQWKEIQQLEGIERFTRLLMAIKVAENSPHLLMVPPVTLREVAEKLDQLTENSAVREMMSNADPALRFGKDTRLMALLLKSLRVRLMEDQKLASQKPTEDQLAAFFSGLPESEQDQLLSLASSDFYADLILRYPRSSQKVNERDLEALAPWPGRDFNNPDRRPDGRFNGRGPGDRDGRPPRPFDQGRPGDDGERPDGPPFPEPRGPRPEGPPPDGFRPDPPPNGPFPPRQQPRPQSQEPRPGQPGSSPPPPGRS